MELGSEISDVELRFGVLLEAIELEYLRLGFGLRSEERDLLTSELTVRAAPLAFRALDVTTLSGQKTVLLIGRHSEPLVERDRNPTRRELVDRLAREPTSEDFERLLLSWSLNVRAPTSILVESRRRE